MSRYDRQVRCGAFGQRGQQALEEAVIFIVGAGALGSTVAEQLARAGTGHLIISDMDVVEYSNLHRQSCYDESDAKDVRLKVNALADHLEAINSEIKIDTIKEEITSLNIEKYLEHYRPTIVIDGTDSFATRFLLNQACHKRNIPWIYGACLGTKGTVYAIDYSGPCLDCLLRTVPDSGEDCSIAGILPPVAHLSASMQVAEVMNYMADGHFSGQLQTFNTKNMKFQNLNAARLKNNDCPTCVHHDYHLLYEPPESITKLCGGKYLVRLSKHKFDDNPLSFQRTSPYFKYYEDDAYQLSLFHDGRAIITGANNRSDAEKIIYELLG